TGMCTGSCKATAAAMCMGKCNGKCTYTPGMATCMGECHGKCSAEASPPRCEGTLDCSASASCRGNCSPNASAHLTCSKPKGVGAVAGDLKLQQAIGAHAADWGEAVTLTLALKDPIADFVTKTGGALSAAADIGLAGGACMLESLKVAGEAKAHIDVSV